MTTSISTTFPRAILGPAIVAVIGVGLWLAGAAPGQTPGRAPGPEERKPGIGGNAGQIRDAGKGSLKKEDEKESWSASAWQIVGIVALAILILVGVIILVVFFKFVGLFVQSWTNGAQISILDLLLMKLRHIDYSMIVRQKISLVQANVKISTDELQRHYQSRGNVPKTAAAVIAAFK